jgi:hypothetical protein
MAASFGNNGTGRTCDAFPNAIPLAIWQGESNDRQPFPGDHGIRVSPVARGGPGQGGAWSVLARGDERPELCAQRSLRGYLQSHYRAIRASSSRIMARSIHASSVHGSASYSLRSRRLRPSQAKVRSTTQRRGSTWPGIRGGAHQRADQSSAVVWDELPDLVMQLPLIHAAGSTRRGLRILTDARG